MDSSAKLSEAELREAAAEAGISPEELRRALVARSSDLPVPVDTHRPTSLATTTALEGRVPLAPSDAGEVVRRILERRSGFKGHRQGDARIDIVDDRAGLVYQIASEADGSGGSLVRVEIATQAAVGSMALGGVIIGAFALGMIAFGYLLSTLVLWLGVGAGVAGGLFLARANRKIAGARDHARALAAEALLEAEDAEAPQAGGPRALPPLGREL